MALKKISDLVAHEDSALESADIIEVSRSNGPGFDSRRLTGTQLNASLSHNALANINLAGSNKQHVTDAQHDILVNTKTVGPVARVDANSLHAHLNNLSPHVGQIGNNQIPITSSNEYSATQGTALWAIDKNQNEIFFFESYPRPELEEVKLFLASRPRGIGTFKVKPTPLSRSFYSTIGDRASVFNWNRDSVTIGYIRADISDPVYGSIYGRPLFIIHNGDWDSSNWDPTNIFDFGDHPDIPVKYNYRLAVFSYLPNHLLGTAAGHGRILAVVPDAGLTDSHGMAVRIYIWDETDFRLNWSSFSSMTNLLQDGGNDPLLFDSHEVSTGGWFDTLTDAPGPGIYDLGNTHGPGFKICYHNKRQIFTLQLNYNLHYQSSDGSYYAEGPSFFNGYNLSIDDIVNGNASWNPETQSLVSKPTDPIRNGNFSLWNKGNSLGTTPLNTAAYFYPYYYAATYGFQLYYDYTLDKLFTIGMNNWAYMQKYIGEEDTDLYPMHTVPQAIPTNPVITSHLTDWDVNNYHYQGSWPSSTIWGYGFTANQGISSIHQTSIGTNVLLFIDMMTAYNWMIILKDSSIWTQIDNSNHGLIYPEPNTITAIDSSYTHIDPTLPIYWRPPAGSGLSLANWLVGAACCCVDTSSLGVSSSSSGLHTGFKGRTFVFWDFNSEMAEVKVEISDGVSYPGPILNTPVGLPVLTFNRINGGITFPTVNGNPAAATFDFMPFRLVNDYRQRPPNIITSYNDAIIAAWSAYYMLGFGYDYNNHLIYCVGIDRSLKDHKNYIYSGSVLDGGGGYTPGVHAFTLSGGFGEGKTATVATIDGLGGITGLTLGGIGTKYEVGNSLFITGGTGAGAMVMVTSEVGGNITGVVITKAGSGYGVGNALALNAGVHATGTVTVDGGGVATLINILVSNRGYGYYEAPTLSCPGMGAGAGFIYSLMLLPYYQSATDRSRFATPQYYVWDLDNPGLGWRKLYRDVVGVATEFFVDDYNFDWQSRSYSGGDLTSIKSEMTMVTENGWFYCEPSHRTNWGAWNSYVSEIFRFNRETFGTGEAKAEIVEIGSKTAYRFMSSANAPGNYNYHPDFGYIRTGIGASQLVTGPTENYKFYSNYLDLTCLTSRWYPDPDDIPEKEDYDTPDNITFAGGSGSLATGIILAVGSNGEIKGIYIETSGSGYHVGDILTVVGGSGSLATVRVTTINDTGGIIIQGGWHSISPGGIPWQGTDIVNPGSGYKGGGFYCSFWLQDAHPGRWFTAGLPAGLQATLSDIDINLGGIYYDSLTTAVTNNGQPLIIPLTAGTIANHVLTYVYLTAINPDKIEWSTSNFQSMDASFSVICIARFECDDSGIVDFDIYERNFIHLAEPKIDTLTNGSNADNLHKHNVLMNVNNIALNLTAAINVSLTNFDVDPSDLDKMFDGQLATETGPGVFDNSADPKITIDLNGVKKGYVYIIGTMKKNATGNVKCLLYSKYESTALESKIAETDIVSATSYTTFTIAVPFWGQYLVMKFINSDGDNASITIKEVEIYSD